MEGTPVTLERFQEWKAKFVKEMEKDKPVEKKIDKKLTGRELFTVNPDMEADGEADGGISIYDGLVNIKNHEEQDELANNVEIDEDLFDADDIEDLEDELDELSVND